MNISLIDTHCHLEMGKFDPDREAVIKRAIDAGLEAMITIGSDVKSNPLALEIARLHESVYCSVGIHPHDAVDLTGEVLAELERWTFEEKVVAVGETGLDYHYMRSPKQTQMDAFSRQLSLAVRRGIPAIIHSREAEADTMRMLRESGVSRGVLHCFSGEPAMAEEAMSMGLYISIAGPVTFKNAALLREVVKVVPDDYLLVETDSPYLTPAPHRGKRNEPAYVKYVAEEIAHIRGVSLADISRITTLNAKRLFGIGRIPEAGEVAYKIRSSLYLNVTNRCTNQCSFCIRFHSDFVKGHRLRLSKEPSAEELISAIGDPNAHSEVVFCGYGEPLIRLDVVKDVARRVKELGGRVRVNTNGHGSLIHKRNILPELHGLVDALSVSLDAHDEETYERLCKPRFEGAFRAVLEFIREAVKYIPEVEASVVENEGVDIVKCGEIARTLGVRLRVRKLDVVG